MILGLVVGGGAPSFANASVWPNVSAHAEEILEGGTLSARLEATEKLALLSPSLARSPLRIALSDPEPHVRIAAANVLLALQLFDLGDAALGWFRSKIPEERRVAAEVIGRKLSSVGVSALGAALSDQDTGVRKTAAAALGRSPEIHRKAAQSLLLPALNDKEPSVRIEVARALGRIGLPSVALALTARLQDAEASVRSQIALAMGVIGNRLAVPALIVAATDQEESVVLAVVQSLGRLGAVEADSTLIALSKESPHREVRRAALRALSQIGDEHALRHVVGTLSDSPEQDEARGLVADRTKGYAPYLWQCVREAEGTKLSACVAALLKIEGPSDPLIDIYRKGRISLRDVLKVFSTYTSRRVILLSVEALSSDDQRERAASLNYLESVDRLPPQILEALIEALKGRDWSADETDLILTFMTRVPTASLSKWGEIVPLARDYLQATSDRVRSAAARLLVAQGLRGESLKELLVATDGAVSRGALSQLTETMSKLQAETVISVLAEGTHGRRKAFQQVLFAVPPGLRPELLDELQKLLGDARGASRDAVLNAFAQNGTSERLLQLAQMGNEADRIKLAQLASINPRGGELAALLAQSTHSRIAALAAFALGERGTKEDVQQLTTLAGGDPSFQMAHYVQAAALAALRRLHERGIVEVISRDILIEMACSSPHLGVRAEALRLAQSIGRPCGEQSLPDVLFLDPDPRIRHLAAELLQRQGGHADSLRRCTAYEPRGFVAKTCAESDLEEPRTVSDNVEPRGQALQLLDLESTHSPQGATLMPTVFFWDGRTRVFVSDRGGQILVPDGQLLAQDSIFSY